MVPTPLSGLTPNIAALAAKGVRAQSMRPSFPSVTFPTITRW